MADSFQISKMKTQFFSFPCGGMVIFSNFKKKFISNFNFFQNFHGSINNFFLDPILSNLFKICKSYLFTLTKKQSYTACKRDRN
jgi:hypothetical protein